MGRTDAISREIAGAGKRGGKQFMDFDRLEEEWGVKSYKPQVGDNFIQIIPPIDEDKYFGVKVFVHYDVGPNGSSYLCPAQMYDKPCPICQERDRLMRQGVDKDELRALNAWPARYVYLVVDTSSAEKIKEGVKVFCASGSINDNILSLSKDPRSGKVIDITDPKEGHDLYFRRKGEKLHTKYDAYRLEEMSDIPEKVMAQIDGMPDLDEFLVRASYEEMKEAMEGGVGMRDREASREEEAPRGRRGESAEPRGRSGAEEAEEEAPRGRRGADADEDSAEQIGRRVRERLARQQEEPVEDRQPEPEEEDRPRRRRR